MKKTLLILLAGCMLTSLFFVSCKEENDPIQETNENQYVNDWIYENMSDWYLWNTHVPAKPDFTATPDQFFESLCYRYDRSLRPEGDRFSWIQENYVDLLNSLSGVRSDEIGFDFQLYLLDEKTKAIAGEILYVKNNTPAQTSGLKRGQFFTKINGTTLTVSNYQQLLSVSGNFSLTVLDVQMVGENPTLVNEVTKNLSAVAEYEENPVYLDRIYVVGGKKIAYLVYHFFADDKNDGTMKYNRDLAAIFTKFKQENVTDLILDLRYNSGGSLLATTYLASMITKNFQTSNIFIKKEYNEIITNELKKDSEDYFNVFFTNEIKSTNGKFPTTPLPNIGSNLQHFFVLTGKNTASAGEIMINGLSPYMEVILLGDTTVGKNVGSISIYEEKDTKNKWGMQPIISKMYNKNNRSDFTAGFVPNYLNIDDKKLKKQLGDPEENLLNQAISLITGRAALRTSNTQQINLPVISSSIDKKPWSNQIIHRPNSLLKSKIK